MRRTRLPHVQQGLDALRDQQPLAALRHFESAHNNYPKNPEAMSYYGWLHGTERGKFEEALDLCWRAIGLNPTIPEMYLNLGKLYVCAEQKEDAIAAYRSGLEVRAGHKALQRALGALGIRRRPVFPNLNRSHFINKILGRLFFLLGVPPKYDDPQSAVIAQALETRQPRRGTP